jgi:hypothetical protein
MSYSKIIYEKGKKKDPLESNSDAHLTSPCIMQSTKKDPLIMPQMQGTTSSASKKFKV